MAHKIARRNLMKGLALSGLYPLSAHARQSVDARPDSQTLEQAEKLNGLTLTQTERADGDKPDRQALQGRYPAKRCRAV
jgi:hypothetical protein